MIFKSLSTKKIKIKNQIIPYDLESLSKYAELEEISFKQLEDDLEEFCYILENCYAGLDAAKSKGLNIGNEKNAIINQLNNKPVVKISDFAEIIYQRFSPYISDTHFSIDFFNNCKANYRFTTGYRLYFSDLYVIEKDEIFYVYEYVDKSVKTGSIVQYENLTNYLYEYPAKGKNVYRFGFFSDKFESKINIRINNKVFEIALYSEVTNKEAFSFFIKQYRKAVYIRYNRCIFNNEEEKLKLQDFSNSAEQCKNKDFIILDIRGNYGGADLYSLKFFSDLYFNNKNKSEKFLKNYKGYVRAVYSLASVQSSIYSLKKYCDISIPDIEKEINKLIKLEKKLTQKPQKIIETNYESKINFNKPAYKGKIIILTDRGVASSGESVLEQAYLFFNKNQVIQIGTNTAGCGSFGNVLSYHLSNSGLQINCGFTDFTKKVNKSNKFHGEGKGFYPDYWCTVNDLSETMESVLNVTKEDELLEIYSELKK